MKVRYFYNPILEKDGDGTYRVNIYMYKNGRTTMTKCTTGGNFDSSLLQVQEFVRIMNSRSSDGRTLRKLFS